MVENIIRINRAEFDRLALLTEKKGYLAASFNIATQDKFPLHNIHYVFENINPGETYEIDTIIEAHLGCHVFKCTVFYRHRCVGVVSCTMKDFDPVFFDWATSYKVKALQRGKEQWLKEVALMTVTVSMTVAYSILYADRVFVESSGKHRLNVDSHSDSDELIYRKLKAYISCEHAPTTPTGKGAKPQHEFDVRGHMRHLKSGKVVYVRPYTKCKGRGTKIIHEYITGGNTDE